MKQKVSITLSLDVLTKVDGLGGSKLSRSALIEAVLRSCLRDQARRKAHSPDLKRINAASDRLNAEAAEVLEYQSYD